MIYSPKVPDGGQVITERTAESDVRLEREATEGADRPQPSPLEGRGLHARLGDFQVEDLSLSLERGKVTAFVGPNGSGKTTLLRMLARLLHPDRGEVCLDGQTIATLSTREVARRLAILPQSPQIPAGVTVEELVEYGRHPYRGLFKGAGPEDREAVRWAMEATGLGRLAGRTVESLSGGERQRAWIAMALAQQTGVLLLDEPTTYLDIRHQVETLALVRELNREHGLTVAWVLHDLNQAGTYSDRIVALRRGRIVAEGPPERVMTAEVIHDIFGVEVTVVPHPQDGSPLLVPSTSPCICRACVSLQDEHEV